MNPLSLNPFCKDPLSSDFFTSRYRQYPFSVMSNYEAWLNAYSRHIEQCTYQHLSSLQYWEMRKNQQQSNLHTSPMLYRPAYAYSSKQHRTKPHSRYIKISDLKPIEIPELITDTTYNTNKTISTSTSLVPMEEDNTELKPYEYYQQCHRRYQPACVVYKDNVTQNSVNPRPKVNNRMSIHRVPNHVESIHEESILDPFIDPKIPSFQTEFIE